LAPLGVTAQETLLENGQTETVDDEMDADFAHLT